MVVDDDMFFWLYLISGNPLFLVVVYRLVPSLSKQSFVIVREKEVAVVVVVVTLPLLVGLLEYFSPISIQDCSSLGLGLFECHLVGWYH